MIKIILSLLLISSFAANANEETTNKVETEVKKSEEKKADKADEVITNKRFRAQTGSLSSLSMGLSLGYNGGSLKKPFSADRPNIAAAGDATSIASMGGSVGGSYRINTLNRIGFGVGVSMLAPFNSTIDTKDARAQKEFDENQGTLFVSDPGVSYTHINKFFGVQTVLSVGATLYTSDNLTAVGYNTNVSGSVNTMYDLGDTGISVGALFVLDRNFFDMDNPEFLGYQAETVFGVLPQAEYVINDTFNLRTIVRSHWYQNTRANTSKYARRPITQSVGLGISVTRDVFLYPNVQFAWDDVSLEKTNVGLSANINLF